MKLFSVPFLTVCILVLALTTATAAEIRYPVSGIPLELRKNAKAVIRENETTFEVKSPESAVMKVHFVITILNDNGREDGYFVQFYDRFSAVRNISGAIYNTAGEKVQRLGESDIYDVSAIQGFSLYEDNRVKFITPDYGLYPYTVEYSYQVNYSGMLDYPEWVLVPDYNISVEKASYTALVPDGLKFRYHPSHLDTRPDSSSDKGITRYYWELSSIPALMEEAYCQPIQEVLPMLYTAPGDFEMEGYPGNAETWQGFGQWIYTLGESRNKLEPQTVSHLKELISAAASDEEAVRILYQYMQDRTRYVSVQIGIGGWQPIEASQVDKLGYGDCKALANYMKSLLDAVGIPAIYTLVRAGENAPRMITGFPSNQFNHAILCVPLAGDTIWLECTDQHIPFGYLGTFTDDRDVLLITKAGGVVAHTPVYGKKENAVVRKAVVDLDDSGHGWAEILAGYSGIYYDELYPILYNDDVKKRQNIVDWISIPSFNLDSFSYEQFRSRVPDVEEHLKLTLPNYCTVIGGRMLLPVDLVTEQDKFAGNMIDRRSAIEIRRASSSCDTIIYTLPPGFAVDKMPESQSISNDFGSYSFELTTSGDQLRYVRLLEWNKGVYPTEEIGQFIDFQQKIDKYDGLKCSLKKAE